MNFMRKLDQDATVTVRPGNGRRLALMLSVPLVIAAVGLYLWLTSGRSVSTDNAQVSAHVVNLAPEIGGRIIEVYVRENQQVKAGDLLYRIDPEPYRIALMQAQAAVGTARLSVSQMQSNYSSKVADIGSKASDVQLASLIHDARFRARSGHLLRLAVLRGRPASLAFVSPHSD